MNPSRTTAEKQEAALLAAFRRMAPRERFKILRAAMVSRRLKRGTGS